MTLRELMNRVLRATGQAQIPCEVSLIEDDNQLLILEYLNQFKEEIEGYNWRSLKQNVFTTVPANVGFAVVGPTATPVTGRARLMRVHDARFGKLIPSVHDITNLSQPFRLNEMDIALMFDQRAMDGGQKTEQPSAFSLDANAEDHLVLRIFPNTTVDRVISTNLFVPQNYLDVTDLDTTIWIPTRALIIGTIWSVLQERGEELGQSSMYTEERFRVTLDNEVAADMAEAGEPELVPV
jgi:hypothetical protein